MGHSSFPKGGSEIQVFRTKLNMPVGVAGFLFILAAVIYLQDLFRNIPVILLIFTICVFAVVLSNHCLVCIAPEGVYIKKYIRLFNRKAVFLPEDRIRGVRVILSLKTHFVAFSTPDRSERIPVDSLVDSEGFMDIIKTRYFHLLNDETGTSKYT